MTLIVEQYEKAVLEAIRIDWPAPRFIARHDVSLAGLKSKEARQIDVAVYAADDMSKPIFIVEAKRHGRPIDLTIAGSTISLMRDVGGIPSMMVSTAGFL